jgi:hypothetical protein
MSSCLSTEKAEAIRVIIRIKPVELKPPYTMPYIMKVSENQVRVDGRILKYDHIFSGEAHQEDVFEKVAKPAVSGLFEGYNGTIFAYGQTGSGKTYTIFGDESSGS